VISTELMWRRHARAALLVAFLPSALATARVLRCDLSSLRNTKRGRSVVEHMPPAAQAVRLFGQAVTWRAAYRHRRFGVTAGAEDLVGWSHGLLPTRS